ncbi:EMBRYO SURROUNDING FACTOR 1-like protein 6 isoform X2 [Arabidopsis lyrata subsp. lyrata]|uniref:EMBRYO SURROUNDING FACTOR 1-like protein 6 isoform X2 n=1 Tax=Arabidopsis lyrata subsp. lyrata TaxID=81972 RepID=UPI000A29C679|nr:EMBRYO SURROUNDING FACTOR 1-like protein 6 isoform X2 [Arabidopsis lyrata subsp. lyrata]|eukprot:XP_020884953.1 EMBRYO SURROUNDING FACTOR 1-like protein 6 isoform X2 [Arabidopsis lyrata subsp. lyrata]
MTRMSSSHFAILCIIVISLVPLDGSGNTQHPAANKSASNAQAVDANKSAGNKTQHFDANKSGANGQGLENNKLGSSVCHLDKCPKHREEVCYCCFNDRRRCYRNLYKCVSVCMRQPA